MKTKGPTRKRAGPPFLRPTPDEWYAMTVTVRNQRCLSIDLPPLRRAAESSARARATITANARLNGNRKQKLPMPSPWGEGAERSEADEGAMAGNFPGKLVLSLRQTDFQTLRAMKIGPLPCGGHASSAIPQGHWLHKPLVPRGVSLALAALCPHAPPRRWALPALRALHEAPLRCNAPPGANHVPSGTIHAARQIVRPWRNSFSLAPPA